MPLQLLPLERRVTWRWLILALALVLNGAVIAALACGPAAPPGQSGGAASTPEATATVAAATAIPTVAAATATPTPVVTPDKLDPVAKGLIALRAATLAAPSPAAGAAGGSGAQSSPAPQAVLIPETVRVHITTLSLENTRRLLEANGGSIDDAETYVAPNNWVIIAQLPVSLLPALSRHPDTDYAFVDGPYRNLPGHLNRMIVEYAVQRLNPGRDAAPEPKPLEVNVRVTKEGYVNARRFLQAQGVRLTYNDEEIRNYFYRDDPAIPLEATGFPQWIPLGLLGPVSQLPGVIYIDESPKPMLHYEPTLHYEPQSRISRQTASTVALARSHGVHAWHAAGITGKNVKVGIIDSGFYYMSRSRALAGKLHQQWRWPAVTASMRGTRPASPARMSR